MEKEHKSKMQKGDEMMNGPNRPRGNPKGKKESVGCCGDGPCMIM
jgi:hypothetical protein